MNGRPIESVKVLKWLGGAHIFLMTHAVRAQCVFLEGIMSSAHIKSGNIRTRNQDGWKTVTLNYICKTYVTQLLAAPSV